MGQDKIRFFAESHIAVPGDDFHGVVVWKPVCMLMIIKETEFYLQLNEGKYWIIAEQ